MGGIHCISPYDGLEKDYSLPRTKKRIPASAKGTTGMVPVKSYNKSKSSGLCLIKVLDIEQMRALTGKIAPTSFDFVWLYAKWAGSPDIGGWNGFMIEATKGKDYEKSRVLFLPFINAPATSYDTILTALLCAVDKCKATGQSSCIVTFDQPLYWKARDIVAAANPDTDLAKVVVRLGGFHLLMSFLGSIGYTMSGSGIESVFKLIYAENCVHNIMSGHMYARAVRAHSLTYLSLAKQIMDNTNFSDEERDMMSNIISNVDRTSILEAVETDSFKNIAKKFSDTIDKLEYKSPTAKLWIQYFRMVSLMKSFIEAERSGNWFLHLDTIQRMIPFFHASGRFLYAKSAHLYLQDMLQLDKQIPEHEFYSYTTGGRFTIRRTNKFWSGIMSDQTIEQTLMRMMKTSGGLTHGRGITDNTLASWTLGMIHLQDVCEQMESFCNIFMDTSEQHIDHRDSRIQRDNKDCEALDQWFSSHEPFLERTELISLDTGIVADSNINCHNALENGEVMVSKVINSYFHELTFKRKNKVLPLSAATSSIVVDKFSVAVDPLMIFQRICASKESIDNIRKYFEYELAPFPLALFSEDGMRKGTKSTLFNAFSPLDTTISLGENNEFIIDGGYLIHTVVWDRNVSFKIICEKYLQYIKHHFGTNVIIVFDGYSDNPNNAGTKSWERLRRSKKYNSTDIICNINTVPPISQEKFLGNENNKKSFIDLLKTELLRSCYKIVQADNDADRLIVTTAIQESFLFDSVTIVAEDIDILVLLTVLASDRNNIFLKKRKKGRSAEKIYSCSSLKHGEIVLRNLLFIHAFSGCDTTSATYNVGKMKFLTTFEKYPELASGAQLFLKEQVEPKLLSELGERFFIALYCGNTLEESIDVLRYKIFTKSVIKTKFNLSSLPPTKDAIHQHSMRVYHQVQIWLGHSKNPESWGWNKTARTLIPIGCTKPAAPPELLKLMFCRCKAKCGKACGCRKAGLKCSSVCQHCSGETCDNVVDIIQLLSDEEINENMPLPILPDIAESPLNSEICTDDFEQLSIEIDLPPVPSKKAKLY